MSVYTRLARGACLTFLVVWAFAAGPASAHYLPHNRLDWWNTEPPPMGRFESFDTLDGWFHPDLVRVYDSERGGWDGHPPIAAVRPVDTQGPTVVNTQVSEGGMSLQVPVLQNGAEVTITGEPGTPATRPPMHIDFSLPQRAVVLQFGIRCNEGHTCLDSERRPGIDPEAVELVAYDDRGFRLGGTTLADRTLGPIADRRTDFLLGFRDPEARIASVALHLTYENAGSDQPPRPVQAVQIVRRIFSETLPPAAVAQTIANADSTRTLPLPFGCDRAITLVRGFQFVDTDEFLDPVLGLSFGLETTVVDGEAIIQTSGRTLVERPAGTVFAPTAIYISVLAWDSRQVELFAEPAYNDARGTGAQTDTSEPVPDPCAGGDCGPAPGADGWPRVAMTEGLRFDYQRSSNESRGWDRWSVRLDDAVARDALRDTLTVSALLVPEVADDGDPNDSFFTADLDRIILTGRSVVEDTNPTGTATIQARDTLPRELTGQWWHYSNDEMEDRNEFCDVDALMAAVGAHRMWFHAEGGNAYVNALDMEIEGYFDGDRMTVRVGGGADIGESFEEDLEDALAGPHGQIFMTPVCVGVEPLVRQAVPIVEPLSFAALEGETALEPENGGLLRNAGPVPFTITRTTFEGDTAPFDLVLHINGTPVHLNQVSSVPSFVLNPGDALLVDGKFTAAIADTRRATLRFESDVAGGAEIEMRVTGRTMQPIEWIPERINFGFVEVGTTRRRGAILWNAESVPEWVDSFELDDPSQEFRLGQLQPPLDNLPVELTSAASSAINLDFSPRTLDNGAPTDRTATLWVVTVSEERIPLELSGTAVPAPEPIAWVSPTSLDFGLVYDGATSTRSVRIESVGAASLIVRDVYPDGADASTFEVLLPAGVSLPAVRPSGETLDFEVRYSATTDDPADPWREAEVAIDTNAGTHLVVLSGYVAQEP